MWNQQTEVTPTLSTLHPLCSTAYPKKYAHGFVVLCFVVVMQSFIMNSHEVFIHIHRGCFAGIGAIVRLPQCQWSKPDGYGEISQCMTTAKHSKAKTVCVFLGIYCISHKMCSRLRFCCGLWLSVFHLYWISVMLYLYQQHIPHNTGLILGLGPANERRRYKLTPSLIGLAQT